MANPAIDAPILIAPTSNVLAHVGRSVILGRELQKRGYRIIFAGLPKYLRDPMVVRPGEFDVYDLPDFDLTDGLAVLRTALKRPRQHSIERNIAAELRLLGELNPQAVIVDFRPTMYISARVRQLPLIALLGGRWLYQYAAQPYRAFRTYPRYRLIRRLLGVKGADLVMPPLQRLAMRYKTGPFVRACRRHGLEPRRTPWEYVVADFNLILDTELLCPTTDLPEHFARVGPIFWAPEQPLPPWMQTLARHRPLIYVTLGSTAHPDLFRLILRSFGDCGYELVMSTGGQVNLRPEEIPRNFHVEKFLPGESVMEHSDLVICHGGGGTLYQAMKTGKPAIVVATHFEQELYGWVIEENGAGVFLTMWEVLRRPMLLHQAVEKVLRNPIPYQQRMQKLQADLKRYEPVTMAADHIEAFIAKASGGA